MSTEPELHTYEVDVLVTEPTTWRVLASSPAEAREFALGGRGRDLTRVRLVEGEVVDVRVLVPHEHRAATWERVR